MDDTTTPKENEERDLESAHPPNRITFEPSPGQGRASPPSPEDNPVGRRRSLSSRRSLSRASSTRTPGPASPYSGVQIEFRTLSIHVSESRQNEAAPELLKPKSNSKDTTAGYAADSDYFANLPWHDLSPDDLLQRLNVSLHEGLSHASAAKRLERDGPNTLPAAKTNYARKLLGYIFGGFCSVLWVGVVIFFLCWRPLSDPPSATNLALAILVMIVIALQASFSAFQDWSTKRTMKGILALLPDETLVRRGNGSVIGVKASELVVGDVVLLKVGSRVPADLRVVSHSADMRFDRSVLTGEAEHVEASVDKTDESFLESRNIALMGSMVVNGSGVGVVVLTGESSAMGWVSLASNREGDRPTLIQQEIWRFVRIIVCLTIILAMLILLSWVGWLRVQHPGFMNVVAMLNNVMGCVVAFIPEGMPVAVALTLMMVAGRMKAVNILPKGLATVETLGCVNVLCSDKTGTLTQGKMTVAAVAAVDHQFASEEEWRSEGDKRAAQALRLAALVCNDASFDPTSLGRPLAERDVLGNATDAAILRFATAGNEAENEALRAANPCAFEIPFNSKNKWMLSMVRVPDSPSQYHVFVKGAPDVLLPACTHFWSSASDSVQPLDGEARAAFERIQEKLSRNAERVIVLCERSSMTVSSRLGTNAFSEEVACEAIADLTIIGILGIMDPPRPEAAAAVAACRRAGVRFFMVTGDFSLTAAAVARNIGIFTGSSEPHGLAALRTAASDSADADEKESSSGQTQSLLLEGNHIAQLVEADWDVLSRYDEIVFARTTPEQELRIVNEFRSRDYVVAVTGDGVNDAPALRAADVGVAVAGGSDVAIDAAHLVLLDAKIDSIVDAIRLGRLVFQNLQKVIAYLLSAGSWSEIWPVLVNVLFGVPLPLSAFLMIIICVFTDLFLSLSLIMEKQEFDLLSLPPRNHKKDHLITARIYVQAYLFMGFMETTIAHAMFL
ncbi:Sodium/potassium-transporting ATPase subunit alpha-2 [Rhypophila decipiens]